MGIFDPRFSFKPYEYPDVIGFGEAIQKSYWLISEFNLTSDIQDFKVKLNDKERATVKRAILAISQIEVAVKTFWAKLGDKLPKSEFSTVGIIFGESECRHQDAYSFLLEILGLNQEFELLLENPVIQGRVEYLTKYLKGAADSKKENYALTLTLFSVFIENVSLFSQFLIIKAFRKHKNVLKDIDNIIDATRHEETLHALFGIYIINQIKEEYPEWFNEDFYNKLYRACKKAYDAEMKIVDWIYEDGEPEFLTRDQVDEFLKHRFNESLRMIGGRDVFEVDEDVLGKTEWFNDESKLEINIDFFNKKSANYSKRTKPIKAEDLF